MSARRRITALMVAGTGVLVAACAPRYQTFTSYDPPGTEEGRYCVADCLEARRACRSDADTSLQQCRYDAEAAAATLSAEQATQYEIDLARFHAGMIPELPPRPRPIQPTYGACNARANSLEVQCADDFDLCYQNCGGTVRYATHCVANCD